MFQKIVIAWDIYLKKIDVGNEIDSFMDED